MDVTFDTGEGIETNEVGAVQLNDDEYIPTDDALDYADLESLYITSREVRTYYPGEWYDAIGDVELNVHYDTRTKEITENGTYICQNCDAWDTIEVNCTGGEYELETEHLTANHNGTYKPSVDGFYSVDVEFVRDYYWERWDFDEYVTDFEARYCYFDGYLHKFGGADGNTSHKILRGDEWEDSVALPYKFNRGVALVIKGKLHLLGSSVLGEGNKHYSFDGTEWKMESHLPTFVFNFSAVFLDDLLYIIGGHSSYQSNYGYADYKSWCGNPFEQNIKWTELPQIPVAAANLSAVGYNGSVYFFKDKSMYKLERKEWAETETPVEVQTAFVVDDGFSEKIHILGEKYHYVYDGDWYIETWFDEEMSGKYTSVVADDIFLEVYVMGVDGFKLDLTKEYVDNE